MARADALTVLVDDLEAGDSLSNWFAVNDGNGSQFPNRCVVRSPLNGERGPNNAWAIHTYGRSARGFQWAMIGRRLHSSPPRCKHAIDAAGFSGVRFWAKGSGAVRLIVGTLNTTPSEDGGTCRQNCYDSHQAIIDLAPDWAQYEVPFSALEQLGFGMPADFEPSQILNVNWGAADSFTGLAGSCFDFWIDDVAFYR